MSAAVAEEMGASHAAGSTAKRSQRGSSMLSDAARRDRDARAQMTEAVCPERDKVAAAQQRQHAVMFEGRCASAAYAQPSASVKNRHTRRSSPGTRSGASRSHHPARAQAEARGAMRGVYAEAPALQRGSAERTEQFAAAQQWRRRRGRGRHNDSARQQALFACRFRIHGENRVAGQGRQRRACCRAADIFQAAERRHRTTAIRYRPPVHLRHAAERQRCPPFQQPAAHRHAKPAKRRPAAQCLRECRCRHRKVLKMPQKARQRAMPCCRGRYMAGGGKSSRQAGAANRHA